MKLYAPELFWALTPEGKAEICNGCGAKGFGWTIPDTLYGLNITPACDIHDFMYAIGVDEEDRKVADRVFLNNMIRIIETKTRYGWLKELRVQRAWKYHLAVKHFGGPAFWKGKNGLGTEQTIV